MLFLFPLGTLYQGGKSGIHGVYPNRIHPSITLRILNNPDVDSLNHTNKGYELAAGSKSNGLEEHSEM